MDNSLEVTCYIISQCNIHISDFFTTSFSSANFNNIDVTNSFNCLYIFILPAYELAARSDVDL